MDSCSNWSAAYGHADYMDALSGSRNRLVREVLIVVRNPPASAGPRGGAREASAAVVARDAEETARALSSLGITAHQLEALECMGVLSRTFSPCEQRPVPPVDPHEPVTAVPAG